MPEGYGVLEGTPQGGGRRAVGIVVSRFNGAVTSKLLEGALAELEAAGVAREAITVMPVPGAFELPIAAMALAKTRRYACIVALGCVIRGDTPHFDFVAGEAASGLQLAALETGVPVAFGVLTLEQADQADDRLEKGAEAVRTGLEMADVFAQLRAGCAAVDSAAIIRRRVQGLRILRQEAVVREQPKPLDGRDPAPLQPEPAEGSRAPERRRQAGLRVHEVPQGRQGPESGLAPLRRPPLRPTGAASAHASR